MAGKVHMTNELGWLQKFFPANHYYGTRADGLVSSLNPIKSGQRLLIRPSIELKGISEHPKCQEPYLNFFTILFLMAQNKPGR